VITSASATGTPPSYGSPTLLIDGTGLLGSGPALSRAHNTTHLEGWLISNTNPANNLTFEMPGPQDLTGVHVWQYSQGTCCTGRGVSSFDMHFSFDGGSTYPTTLAGQTLSPASGTSNETAQTLSFALQSSVTHVKFDNMIDFPALPSPGWQGLNEVRFEATGIPGPLLGTPIGNELTPRDAATDTSDQVFWTNFVPVPERGFVDGVFVPFQDQIGTFRMFQLRPTGGTDEYDVIYDSGPMQAYLVDDAVNELLFPNGRTIVEPGDIFAHYGRGIPYSLAGGTNAGNPHNIYYPVPVPPGVSDTITLGLGGLPEYPQSRDYAWAVSFYVPEPSALALAALGLVGLAFAGRRRRRE
jgi:hypothetical protein